MASDDELLAVFDAVAKPSAGSVYEAHRIGLRAVAAAAWDEGKRAAYEEFEKDPRGLYFTVPNPYSNALISAPTTEE